MTIAICVCINDGLILAADSAATMINQETGGPQLVANVYNNANKVMNLCRELPIGTLMWGLGGIGPASMETLLKDLRRRFGGLDPDFSD